MLDVTTIQKVQNEYLYLTTIPFSLIIFRLLFLVNIKNTSDNPIYFFENDTTLKTLITIYFITLLIILNAKI